MSEITEAQAKESEAQQNRINKLLFDMRADVGVWAKPLHKLELNEVGLEIVHTQAQIVSAAMRNDLKEMEMWTEKMETLINLPVYKEFQRKELDAKKDESS